MGGECDSSLLQAVCVPGTARARPGCLAVMDAARSRDSVRARGGGRFRLVGLHSFSTVTLSLIPTGSPGQSTPVAALLQGSGFQPCVAAPILCLHANLLRQIRPHGLSLGCPRPSRLFALHPGEPSVEGYKAHAISLSQRATRLPHGQTHSPLPCGKGRLAVAARHPLRDPPMCHFIQHWTGKGESNCLLL